MVRCLDYIKCTVVGFNFGYVTLAIGIIGVSFIRRIASDPIAFSMNLFTIATEEKGDWRYPFDFYIYASFIPLIVSTFAFILAFIWVSVIRPSCFSDWKVVCCKEATSVLFVLLMIAYTGALFPGPIYGIRFSDKLKNITVQNRLRDELSLAIKTNEYYSNVSALETTPFGTALDFIQQRYNCCGIKGVEDYNSMKMDPKLRFSRRYGIPFPQTCCLVIHTKNGSRIDLPKCYQQDLYYFSGYPCFKEVLDKVEESFYILDGAGFSAVAIGLIAVIMSIIFAVFNVVLQMQSEKNDDRSVPMKIGDRRA